MPLHQGKRKRLSTAERDFDYDMPPCTSQETPVVPRCDFALSSSRRSSFSGDNTRMRTDVELPELSAEDLQCLGRVQNTPMDVDDGSSSFIPLLRAPESPCSSSPLPPTIPPRPVMRSKSVKPSPSPSCSSSNKAERVPLSNRANRTNPVPSSSIKERSPADPTPSLPTRPTKRHASMPLSTTCSPQLSRPTTPRLLEQPAPPPRSAGARPTLTTPPSTPNVPQQTFNIPPPTSSVQEDKPLSRPHATLLPTDGLPSPITPSLPTPQRCGGTAERPSCVTVQVPNRQVSGLPSPSPEAEPRLSAGRSVKHEKTPAPPTKCDNSWYPHENHWYPDGSVLIQCGRTRFKLHKSLLERSSPFFYSLLEGVPDWLPPNGIPPVRDITHRWDDADGFALLLSEQCEPSIIDKMPPQKTLQTIIRASKALEFMRIYERSVRVFEGFWSAQHDNLKPGRLQDPCPAIRLSRELGIPSVLSRACYEVFSSNDFAQSHVARAFDLFCSSSLSDAARYEALDCIGHIRDFLGLQWSRFVAAPPKEYPTICPHSVKAEDSPESPMEMDNHKRWSKYMHCNNGLAGRFTYDPIRGMEMIRRTIELRPKGSDACATCKSAINAGWDRRKERVWNDFQAEIKCLANCLR